MGSRTFTWCLGRGYETGLTEMTDFFQEYGKPTLRDCQASPGPRPPISPATPPPPTIVLSTKQILDLLTFKHTLSLLYPRLQQSSACALPTLTSADATSLLLGSA